MSNLSFSLAYLVAVAAAVFIIVPHRALGDDDDWQDATATWYGPPSGGGSDGGACGFAGEVNQKPFNSRIVAMGPALFKGGKGCGQCYQVKCTKNDVCSGNPVSVVVTDECPGGVCTNAKPNLDLSGTAYSAMALSGKEQDLLNAGLVDIEFQRADCEYGRNIEFGVNSGATPYWFSVLVKYINGDDDLESVQLKQRNSSSWQQMEQRSQAYWVFMGGQQMQQQWGAYWVLNGGPLQPPFSITVTLEGGDSVAAEDVIPENWQAGATYASNVQF